MSDRPKTAPGLAPAEWHGYALDCEERIAELEKECAQWQESSGQNYVRAQEAELLCDRADEIMARYAHEAEVDEKLIKKLEATLNHCREIIVDKCEDSVVSRPVLSAIAEALKESAE